MRKILIMLLIIVLAFSCSGCFQITEDEGYELNQDNSQIKSISVHEYIYPNHRPEEEPLAILELSQFDSFADDLEALPFKDTRFIILIPAAVDPNIYFREATVRIAYLDGSYELISNCLQNYSKKDGYYTDYTMDANAWYDFLEEYFGNVFERSD